MSDPNLADLYLLNQSEQNTIQERGGGEGQSEGTEQPGVGAVVAAVIV